MFIGLMTSTGVTMAISEHPETRPAMDADYFNRLGANLFPGFVGVEFLSVTPKQVICRLNVRKHHLAVNGMLHGATIVTLADNACGCGTIALLPEGSKGHATIELKCNFLSSVREGFIRCEAIPLHLGRSTHVWDARVFHEETGRILAFFRCTQMILW